MSDSIAFEQLTSMSEQIRRREVTSVAATRAMLDRITALDGVYRSYTTVLGDRAMGARRSGRPGNRPRDLARPPCMACRWP